MAELEAELQEMVARGREIFVQVQDSLKKELTRRFPAEDFSWIDDIFPDEEGEGEEQAEENPTNWVFIDAVIDIENTNVIQTREAKPEDVPPM